MKHIKRAFFNLLILITIIFITYATIVWIYPKAIEIGVLIGGTK